MTIVVGGYIVAYPLGGMTWHHLNYLLGLHELGHEVWFLEDSGEYSLPYDPQTQRCGIDSSYGRAYLERTFREYGLPLRYCYYSQFEDRHYGLSEVELRDLLKRTDLLLCVSGVTPLRDSRPRPWRTAVIDTDPVFTQLRMSHDSAFAAYYRGFDRVATFGRLIGTSGCPLPAHGVRWIPTQQPIALKHWPLAPAAEPHSSKPFTTLGKWEHDSSRTVEFEGREHLSSKATEWLKLLDLPRRSAAPLMLAMDSVPADVRARFEQVGWSFADAQRASRSCESFRAFIRDSAGEFTVAKQIYASVPSGWFSDRSACYLATGRPVITQSTGFETWLPAGEGVLSFSADRLDEAAGALGSVRRDYARHALAARGLAEQHFDSRRVLSDLLAQIVS